MFGLDMVLYMGNLLRVVSTFSALPKAIIVLEHATVHQDVQSLDCFSMRSFIKMIGYILLINFEHI